MNTRIKGILQCAAGRALLGGERDRGAVPAREPRHLPGVADLLPAAVAGVCSFYFSLTGQTGIWSIWQNKKDRIRILVFGMLGMIWTQYGYFAAIKYSNAPTATVLEYLMPILIIFWYCLSERRLPHLVEIFCTVFAFVGTVFIATHGNFGSLALSEKALFWGLLAAVACALYTVEPVGMIKRYGAPIVVGWGMVIAGLPSCLHGALPLHRCSGSFCRSGFPFVSSVVRSVLRPLSRKHEVYFSGRRQHHCSPGAALIHSSRLCRLRFSSTMYSSMSLVALPTTCQTRSEVISKFYRVGRIIVVAFGPCNSSIE